MTVKRGAFDTDQMALAVRERVNRGGTINLEELLFERLQLQNTHRVLEIGSGRGKQTTAVKERFPLSQLVTVDVADAPPEDVLHLQMDMDALRFGKNSFDRIYSVYAVYYSQALIKLIENMVTWLKPHGRIVLMGPGDGTNNELYELLRQCGYAPNYVQSFMSPADRSKLERHSLWRGDITVTYESHVNQIPMTDDDLMRWWRSHNSFIAECESAVAAKANTVTTLTKVIDVVIIQRGA